MADQQHKSGEDVTALMGGSGEDVTALMASHKPYPEARPIATGGGRGTGLDVRKSDAWAKRNAPAIGATMATVATGGTSIPLLMAAAGFGGAAGSGLRGDDAATIATEGGKQALLQGVGGGLVKIGGAAARGVMRGGIPKNIQADFGGREVAQEALDTGAVPGVASSARRVSRLSNEANAARDAAAATVPQLSGRKIIDGLRKIHGEAVAAKMPDRVRAIADRAGEIRREVGTGLDGPAMLARKGILQQEGKAAVNAPNPKMAAVGPQIANAERDAIVSHLRETPGMEQALNTSQRRMGLDRWMQDAKNTSMVSRARQSLPSALLSPTGLAVTGHAINQGRRAVDPQVIRALMAQLQGQR
jgi:hypothetical protein